MTDSATPASAVPDESVGRGIVTALGVVPIGVIAWVLLWEAGFIASIVALGIAWGAAELYRRGSGGPMRRNGAIAILVITVVTLLLAFFAGLVYDAADALGKISGLSTWGAFTNSHFWPTFWDLFPDEFHHYLGNFALAIAFGALGAFRTLRRAFLESAPA